jgi:hypothetical protein
MNPAAERTEKLSILAVPRQVSVAYRVKYHFEIIQYEQARVIPKIDY